MSPLDSNPDDGKVQKQKANIYLMLLILSFLALVIGCVFCALEMASYDWKIKPPRTSYVPAQTTAILAEAAVPSTSVPAAT